MDQWQKAVDDYYLNFYVRNPEYLEMLPENKQLAISNSLSQVRQYNEMPLKILKADSGAIIKAASKAEQAFNFLRELARPAAAPVPSSDEAEWHEPQAIAA